MASTLESFSNAATADEKASESSASFASHSGLAAGRVHRGFSSLLPSVCSPPSRSSEKSWGERGFVVTASSTMCGGRRRLDANRHNPGVAAIYEHLSRTASSFTAISDAGYTVWVPGRYKRIPAEEGVKYWDSEDLMQVNPDLKKRYADCRFGDDHRGRVQSGWLLVPSSGQLYGIIGTAIVASTALHEQVVSNHVIRVAPTKSANIRVGYLATALSHPTLGRPIVKSLAFGSSVPEIDSDDFANLKIVRLSKKREDVVADLAEQATEARGEADRLEQEIAMKADKIINQFIT